MTTTPATRQGALTSRDRAASGHPVTRRRHDRQDALSRVDVDQSGSPVHADAVTKSERADVRISVNTRSEWHQWSMLDLHSPELRDHLEAIAAVEWRRYKGWRTIAVTATNGTDLIEVVHGIELPPCPQCGFTRSSVRDF